MTTSSRSDELLQTTAEADTLPNSSNSNSSVDQGGGRMEAIRAELLTLAGKQYSLAKDIERSYLSLVLHTLSKSIMHYSLPRVEWGVMWEAKSMPRICKYSYEGKVFSNIFISV
jgi:hypothetical protein